MLIKQPPMEIVTEFHTCTYHKRNPGNPYAGCTCSGMIGGKVKPVKDWTEQERLDYFGYDAGDDQ